MIDSAGKELDIYGNDYRKSDLPEESGISIALYVSFSLCFVVGALICFYCLYPRIRKKSADDEEKDSGSSASEELQNINTKENTSVNPPQRKISHWDRLGSIFQAKTATTELEYRLQMSNTRKESQTRGNKNGSSTSIYEKPAMGDMTVNLVQPPSRDNSYRSGTSATTTKRKSIIPESVLQSLEPWLTSEDTQSPQGSDYIGRLQFSVAYAFDSLTLIVKVIKAIDLPPMDLSGSSDPFVKCCLLPDRKRKLESKIRRKTLNPSWNETLLFEGLPYDKIQQRVLYMQVMDWDRFSRNDPIGEVCIPLNHINLADNEPQWEYLAPCKGSNKRGQLLIALCYYPENGTIEVTIKQAKNLKPMDIGGTSDPYVKIWLLVRGKRIEKKKTTTVKNSLNPTFDETFTFNSTMDRLRETQLEINVMDRDKIGRNDTIGKIYLGTKSNSLEKRHWKEMLMKSKTPVEQWHILKI